MLYTNDMGLKESKCKRQAEAIFRVRHAEPGAWPFLTVKERSDAQQQSDARAYTKRVVYENVYSIHAPGGRRICVVHGLEDTFDLLDELNS